MSSRTHASRNRLGAVLLASGTLVATGAAVPATASARPQSPQVLRATGAPQKVIVLLRDQHRATPADRAHAASRARAVRADQTPLRSEIAALGGTTTHTYTTLNAVSATVPSGGLAMLRANPAVASVVPDLVRHRTIPTADGTAAATSRAAAPTAASYCGTKKSPKLEPEALGLTHTASDAKSGTPATQTARSLGYDGAGVKVAVIADGLDVNQPDLLRADGSHVVTDYQDFSGDGVDAATPGEEEMGDASSVAAQGRTAYDLSGYVSLAHPLPKNCDIRIEGMAPGSSLVALKIFPNALLTAPTSAIIQAIDYATNVDHVDVINESFGSNPYPDTASDPVSAFNQDAVDAGITVVASSGDAGIGSTLGSASTDPNVIGVGASTSERLYAQTTSYGFQLGNGRYTSDQVSALSSSGISQTNRTEDLIAPGDLGWALCSDRLAADGSPLYTACANRRGQPSPFVAFGGSSESAPLTAGAAALVIQSYRGSHGGDSPTPAQVRQVLDSSADDLGLPAAEQGAGLLDSYRAVQLARGLHPAGTAAGSGLLLGTTQLDGSAPAGAPVAATETVTNAGSTTRQVTASLRALSHVSGSQHQTVMLSASSPTATFVDGSGILRSYVLRTFTVPAGTDRLDASVATGASGAGRIVRLSLLDPQQTYAAYSLPQGLGDFGQVDIHQPAAGTWTAIVWTSANAAGYSGPVSLRTTDDTATSVGTVVPAAFALAPGASQQVKVTTRAPASDANATSLVLSSAGESSTAPLVIRAVDTVSTRSPFRFTGRFDAGNGRSFGPAQTFTYRVDVPAGARDLAVDLTSPGAVPNLVVAHLTDPSGEPVATALNEHPTADGASTDTGLQIIHARPVAGVWSLTVELANPIFGARLPRTFHGSVALDVAQVTSHGVPTSTGTVVSRRTGSQQTITIANTSPQAQTYYVDPRSDETGSFPLVALPPAVGHAPYVAEITAPLASDDVLPAWNVPTQASTLTVHSSATGPIDFDVMSLDTPTALNSPNNPDVEASITGDTGVATHHANEVVSSRWAAFPTPVGPDPAGGSTPVDVSLVATVSAAGFADEFSSSTGDAQLATVRADAPAATPVTIPAGGTATVTLTLAPSGAVGSTQGGTLFVDTIDPFGAAGTSTLGDEVAAIPFAFTVGR